MNKFNAVLAVAEKAAMVIDVIVPAVRKVFSIIEEQSYPRNTSSAFLMICAVFFFEEEVYEEGTTY